MSLERVNPREPLRDAAERRELMLRDLCPTCTPEKNIDCRYRGEAICRIAPSLKILLERKDYETILARAEIPRAFWRSLPAEMVTDAVAWTRSTRSRKLRCLAGKSGRGKSHAAAEWVAGSGGLFVRADLFAFYRQRDENDLLPIWKSVKALVIDDLGVENSPSGWGTMVLCHVVAERADNDLPTLLTTKLLPNCQRPGVQVPRCGTGCLMCRYGESFISRLDGGGGYHVCEGSDLRQERK